MKKKIIKPESTSNEVVKKLDDVIQRFNHLDKNVTHALMKTDQRIESIEKRMVTKEDAKNFATKDDLKNFATKDDLKNFATKDDLRNFATKDDLKRFPTKDDPGNFATKDDFKRFATKDDISRIAMVLDDHGRKLDRLQETKAEKVDLDRLVDKIDFAMKSISVFDQEERVQSLHLVEAQHQLKDHEKRLVVLETRSI